MGESRAAGTARRGSTDCHNGWAPGGYSNRQISTLPPGATILHNFSQNSGVARLSLHFAQKASRSAISSSPYMTSYVSRVSAVCPSRFTPGSWRTCLTTRPEGLRHNWGGSPQFATEVDLVYVPFSEHVLDVLVSIERSEGSQIGKLYGHEPVCRSSYWTIPAKLDHAWRSQDATERRLGPLMVGFRLVRIDLVFLNEQYHRPLPFL